MDGNPMTFEEILFHGRYHIIGGVLFLVFFVVFVRESVREMKATWDQGEHALPRVHFGRLFHDPMLGPTMTDGGEPEKDHKKKD